MRAFLLVAALFGGAQAQSLEAPTTRCKKTLIPIDATHTCDVGIPACEECPGKKIEYLPCADCECGVEQQDCVWGDWGPWSTCSMGALVDGDCLDCPDCCNGVQRRERSIALPSKCGGKPCNGSDKEIQACGQNCKPPGCSWTDWEDWSECSKSCGGGQKYRKRKMVGNKATTCCNKDLEVCDGPSIEWCGCNTQCCGGKSGCLCESGGCDCGVCMTGQNPAPVDCEWGQWTDWMGTCESTKCGAPGALTRTREIKTFSLNSGKPCCGESREVKPCGQESCGHDCKYAPWTDWSGCTEACGGGQKYRHREIFFVPNGKDHGGEPCSPKDTTDCPDTCYTPQEYELPGGSCPCIEKKKMTVTCKSKKTKGTGTTEVSETASCNMGDCKCYWEDWTPWSACSKKCGGGYKVRCKMQQCASTLGTDYNDPKLKAAMDPCDPSNADLPSCGKSGWCTADEWGEPQCSCDTGMFFVQDKTVTDRTSGVCVTKATFDTYVAGKFVIADEVIQPVKLSGVPGLQLNDAETILEQTTKKVLSVAPENVAVRYNDHKHEERVTTPTLDAQKLYLTEAPAKFNIQVRCQQSNQQCNLVQMELLAALRDRKTEFNTALRKFSGKDSAYLAASGMPAVTSLSQNLDQFEDGAGASASSATNLFLMLVAGMAMTTLGFVTFHKLTKRSRQELSREDEQLLNTPAE